MKTIKRCAKTIFIPLAIMILFSLSFTGILYSEMNDKTDRLSNEQSNVFSPGYINAAKQKADSIVNQVNGNKKRFNENVQDNLTENIGKDVTKASQDMITPELKKKTSSGEGSKKTAEATQVETIGSLDYNINIGSGTNKVYDNGRLISEVIDGEKYIYAGFANVGVTKIQDAINRAVAGDNIIVKGGAYNEGVIRIAKPIKLYGGYNDNGVRDIKATPTSISGSIGVDTGSLSGSTEINGFSVSRVNNYAMAIKNSQSVVVKNCTISNLSGFTLLLSAVWIENSKVEISSNTIASYRQIGGPRGYNYTGIIAKNSVILMGTNDIRALSPITATSGGQISTAPTQTASVSSTGLRVTDNNNQLLDRKWSDYGKTGYTYGSDYLQNMIGDRSSRTNIKGDSLKGIFKGLLANKDALQAGADGAAYQDLLARIVRDALGNSALAVPGAIDPQELDIAIRLADIMKNPTEDQKLILDAVQALLVQTEKAIGQSGSPELKKATDDLLQMVASVLIAQAIPDLLKEGDVANVKSIFTELNTTKVKIMTDYQESVKPYYEEMKKILSKNMATLQLNNIVSKSIIEDKLSPNEIDKILEKLRKASSKSFEEEYILQQEAKYRKTYIEPNKKVLEEKMKMMMRDFTQRLSKILEGADAIKKN